MSQSLFPAKPILMIDDEESWLVSLEALLARHNRVNNTVTCTSGSEGMKLLAEQEFSLVLLDYGMSGLSGEELLSKIVFLYPKLPVVVLTGYDHVPIAVRCKELGAADYIIKTEGELSLALKILEVLWKNIAPPPEIFPLSHPELLDDVVTKSPGMAAACRKLDGEIEAHQSLLLVGEAGAGKKFLARKLMSKQTGNVIELDAKSDAELRLFDGTWVDTLLTNSKEVQIYLENIDALSGENQLQLFNVLQQKSKTRFILTLANLGSETTDQLRKDLLYLLKSHMIEIPPLRERKEDIPELTHILIQQAAKEYGKKTPTPPAELDLLLQSYSFPGNVSELKSMVFDAVKNHQSRKMSMDSFKQAMAPSKKELIPQLHFSEVLPTIDEAIALLVDEAEKRADGNQSIMAGMLGVSRQALNRRLSRRKNK